jgi:hypothetical protein
MFRIPNFPYYIPWFMYDIDNQQLITSKIVPSDIIDSKSLIYAEIQIPGLNGQPIQAGGFGNNKISFTLKIIKRDGLLGNLAMLKQFDQLRQPKSDLKNILKKGTQFQSNPKVLYYWGIGRAPQIWYVTICDFVHRQNWINQLANPKYTDLSIELTLDEFNPINKLEDTFRKIIALTGNSNAGFDAVSNITKQRPY